MHREGNCGFNGFTDNGHKESNMHSPKLPTNVAWGPVGHDLHSACWLPSLLILCSFPAAFFGCFLEGSATYPPANPNDPSEEELILEGCIKDILSLGALADCDSADVSRVLEITQDFDPNLPSGGDIGTPCPRDTLLDSACTCTTGVVCSEGQSCDGAGCLDRDCRAFFRAFSCPSGRVPAQLFLPLVNCTAGTCPGLSLER